MGNVLGKEMTGKPRSRERCGANCRTKDTPCERPRYPGSPRCKFHAGPLTPDGRKRANEALIRGRETVKRNRQIKREAKQRAKEAAMQWVQDFSPNSPLVDALIDEAHAAHTGTLEHARKLVAQIRAG
jgi:hypothetical protein